jgi:hypothetical protein
MEPSQQTPRPEARWPVMLAILVVLALLELLPSRVRLLPQWTPYLMAAGVLAPMLAAAVRPHSPGWARAERLVVFGFIVLIAFCNLAMLRELIVDMLRRSQTVSGLQLLTSSIALWAMNVLMFSLLFWEIDRGGPSLRVGPEPPRPDWLFPSDQAPPEQLAPGWRPGFVDYLFLGFSTATAFSTTDALPLTSRAKLAMMAESTISLVTLVVVGARAINVLGS